METAIAELWRLRAVAQEAACVNAVRATDEYQTYVALRTALLPLMVDLVEQATCTESEKELDDLCRAGAAHHGALCQAEQAVYNTVAANRWRTWVGSRPLTEGRVEDRWKEVLN